MRGTPMHCWPALGLLMLMGCGSVVERPVATSPPPPAAAGNPLASAPRGSFALRGHFEQGGVAFGTAPAGALAISLDGRSVMMTADRRFLLGFDRDQGPDAQLVAKLADGGEIAASLKIAPRQWQIESLPTLPKGTTPTPEFLERRAKELVQIAEARKIASGSMGWLQALQWPVKGRISGIFGSQRIYAGEPGSYHSGVDVAGATGTPVAAPADGVVILAADAPFTLEGNLLMIDHGMGLNSAFLHLSRIDVKPGDHVRQGQIVGAIGMTGRATGPHLHWGMKWQDVRIDPATLAGPMAIP